jgi:hypothetical protein
VTAPTRSYEKVHYELRPSKQVERKMLVDTFMELTAAGFPIRDYQYTGMGSFYFIDFALFHRYLGICNMLSVEFSSEIEKRVQFNSPFGCIKLALDDISNQIPSLSSDLCHILWLDYDSIITADIVDAIVLAAGQLSCGSILLVTVDAEPPTSTVSPLSAGKYTARYYEKECGLWMPTTPRAGAFARSRLPFLNREIISRAIVHGLRGRQGVSYEPLFCFVYADGHQMLSVGGMIAGQSDASRLGLLNTERLPFLRRRVSSPPFQIRVPMITRRERLTLEANMPSNGKWKPDVFGMSEKDFEEYCRLYRYYPAYTETLL